MACHATAYMARYGHCRDEHTDTRNQTAKTEKFKTAWELVNHVPNTILASPVLGIFPLYTITL